MQIEAKEHSGIRYYTLEGQAASEGQAVGFILHGYGANGRDLIPLITYGDYYKRWNCRWVFLEGPLAVPISPYENGNAWFPLNMERLFQWTQTRDLQAWANWEAPGLDEAARAVRELIAHESNGSSKVVLGGFSQGSMVALETALSGVKTDALLLLSSTWVKGENWSQAIAKSARELNVFQSHGKEDPILPFEAAEKLHRQFESCGVKTEFHPFMGGHEIPMDVLRSLYQFLDQVLKND